MFYRRCPTESGFEGSSEECDIATCLAHRLKQISGCEDVDDENIREWLHSDASEPGFEQLSDADIVNKLCSEEQESEAEPIEEPVITHTEAMKSIDLLLEYAGQNSFDYTDVLTLRKLRTVVRKNANEKQKQKKMDDYFPKIN